MQTWRVTQNTKDKQKGRIVGPLVDAPCALGRAGLVSAESKQEGDGKTPAGTYPFRRVFYRPDKMVSPICTLDTLPVSADLGWCDDVKSPHYNKLVRLPFSASHEKMWRDDALYDLVLVIGHNDSPPVQGKGSAVFVHVAKEGFAPTEGCVALTEPALLAFIRLIKSGDQLIIG